MESENSTDMVPNEDSFESAKENVLHSPKLGNIMEEVENGTRTFHKQVDEDVHTFTGGLIGLQSQIRYIKYIRRGGSWNS